MMQATQDTHDDNAHTGTSDAAAWASPVAIAPWTTPIPAVQIYQSSSSSPCQADVCLPPSVPVDRLFGIEGQILTPRRNRLTDEHFELILMLRVNTNLM